LFEEPFSPLGDDLPTGVEAGGDLVVIEPTGRHENDLGPDNLTIQ